MNKIIEALLGLVILNFIGGRGRAFAKYRLSRALAQFVLARRATKALPERMDRKELARLLKQSNNNLRKIRP